MVNIPVLVDTPNYINRLLDIGIHPRHISRQLSGVALAAHLTEEVRRLPHTTGTCETVEFVCSPRLFGGGSKKFTPTQQAHLLDRLRRETGVHVDQVNIPGTSEKGVDTTIAGRLEDLAGTAPAVVLLSADRDFIPTLHKLRRRLRVILVKLVDPFPVELANEAFATIDMVESQAPTFHYSYPHFNIESLTLEQIQELYAEADDRALNQVRVRNDGMVFISRDHVGANSLEDIKFRLETFGARNGYVGPKAASDEKYIDSEFANLTRAWRTGFRGYLDHHLY